MEAAAVAVPVAAPVKAAKQDLSTVQVKKRMYVGGLSSSTTQEDLRGRFQSFGKISAVEVPLDKYTGEPRGFAYVSMETNEAKWNQCLSILNNASWKGSKLKIHEAKPDFAQRIAIEKAAPPEPEKKKPKAPPPKRLADDMSLITEENFSKHRGWKKGKFNIPVAVMKCFLRYSRKNFLVYDPTKLKNHIRRFTKETPDVPLAQLTWSLSTDPAWKRDRAADGKSREAPKQQTPKLKEAARPAGNLEGTKSTAKTDAVEKFERVEKAEKAQKTEKFEKPEKTERPEKVEKVEKSEKSKLKPGTSEKSKGRQEDIEVQIKQAKAAGFLESDSEESWHGSDTETALPAAKKPEVAVPKEQPKKDPKAEQQHLSAEERRVQSLKQREEEKKSKMESIQKALQGVDSKVESKNHISFTDDGDDEAELKAEVSTKPAAKTNWMDSDDDGEGEKDEELEHDFHINEVFKDEATSKELMKMQMKYGDSRFRLTDLFIDKPKTQPTDTEVSAEDSEEAALKKQLSEERSSALGVLTSLLGAKQVSQTQHVIWKEPAFYDPNNPASKKFEKEASADKRRPKEDEEMLESVEVIPAESSSQPPEVSDKRFFQVRSTYHDLYASSSAAGFSILGGPVIQKKAAETFSFGFGEEDDSTSGKRKRADEEAGGKKSKAKEEEYRISMDPEETRARLQKSPLFFFHLHNSEVKGGLHRLAIIDKFQRTGTLDDVIRGWEGYRSELTQEYKRKHKSTSRKKVRMSRKRKAL